MKLNHSSLKYLIIIKTTYKDIFYYIFFVYTFINFKCNIFIGTELGTESSTFRIWLYITKYTICPVTIICAYIVAFHELYIKYIHIVLYIVQCNYPPSATLFWTHTHSHRTVYTPFVLRDDNEACNVDHGRCPHIYIPALLYNVHAFGGTSAKIYIPYNKWINTHTPPYDKCYLSTHPITFLM